MNIPSRGSVSMHALDVEVAAELVMAESSHPEELLSMPVTEWLFDPTDVERDEVGLRVLLGAVEALGGHSPRAWISWTGRG